MVQEPLSPLEHNFSHRLGWDFCLKYLFFLLPLLNQKLFFITL